MTHTFEQTDRSPRPRVQARGGGPVLPPVHQARRAARPAPQAGLDPDELERGGLGLTAKSPFIIILCRRFGACWATSGPTGARSLSGSSASSPRGAFSSPRRWCSYAIDDLTSSVTGAKLAAYGALLLAIGVVGGVFRFLMRRILTGASRDIEYDMRNDFFAHLETHAARVLPDATGPAT